LAAIDLLISGVRILLASNTPVALIVVVNIAVRLLADRVLLIADLPPIASLTKFFVPASLIVLLLLPDIAVILLANSILLFLHLPSIVRLTYLVVTLTLDLLLLSLLLACVVLYLTSFTLLAHLFVTLRVLLLPRFILLGPSLSFGLCRRIVRRCFDRPASAIPLIYIVVTLFAALTVLTITTAVPLGTGIGNQKCTDRSHRN